MAGSFELSNGGTRVTGKIIRARPFGRPGDVQFGIDILAEMEGGEVWDFQCKHVEKWTPDKTRKAIAAYKRDATRKFLLVTCDVPEECHNVIAEHPGWALWDAREITRRFRELGAFAGGPILFTHFGPGWSEAFFGQAGDGPFLGAEAKYANFLHEGRRFHHRHAQIGRESFLAQLDAFARDDKQRVLLLIGRGGLGKSRLLLEWSRRIADTLPEFTLRFTWDKNTRFSPSLQVAPKPFIVVMDDAHRFPEAREALALAAQQHPGVKIVLALRPGPVGQVMQELLGAGFDTSEIVQPAPMKSLTDEQTMQLVDAALQGRFPHLRGYLLAAAHHCPLVAVIGAELIVSGALNESDLRDTAEVQRLVFESMLKDADSVREQFGAEATDDFLRLVALLGPVKLDAPFFQKAAPFLSLTSADRVTRLRDALDAAGLLLTTGAGTRIVPDLLSDHLAYDACYDKHGQSRTFAERLLESFSWEQFPTLMQHLAEAEWRAGAKANAASVVEPLWMQFKARFQNSTFWDRSEQLHQWMNIAHLQPERTLHLAELALTLKTAPPRESLIPQLNDDKWNNHERSLEWLTQMLGPVADYHPDYVARVFDLLWALGKDDAKADYNNNRSHPFSVIHEVMTFKLWKGVKWYDAAFDWIERLFAGDEWLNCKNSPAIIFERFLHPLLVSSIWNTWRSRPKICLESHQISIERTEPIRERVRKLCRSVLARNNAMVASQIIPTLDKACDIARKGFSEAVPPDFDTEWDKSRLKFLEIFSEILRDFSETLLHFQVRRVLMRCLRHGKSETFKKACRKVFDSIPDNLDLRIARVVCGNDYDEFEQNTGVPNWHKVEKAKWNAFIERVAEETCAAHDKERWFDYLKGLKLRWSQFRGVHPNFRQLVSKIAESHNSAALKICEQLLATPEHPFVGLFDALLMPATVSSSDRRLVVMQRAASSQYEVLKAVSVACCSWWRNEGGLPEEAWLMLERLALSGGPLVSDQLTSFVWWGNKQPTLRDWNLITSIPFSTEQRGLISSLLSQAANLIDGITIKPTLESVSCFIARLESIREFDDFQMLYALEKFAESYPAQVFLMLWRRNKRQKKGEKLHESLAYDFEHIPLRNICNEPEVAAVFADFDSRMRQNSRFDYYEMRLLQHALAQGGEAAEAWLNAALLKVTTEEHLDVLRQLASPHHGENAAMANPQFTRRLLEKARSISPACHEKMFHQLLHIGGVRGTSNNEPDDATKAILESIERLAHQHAADSELGPLFAAMAKHERSWMQSMRAQWHELDDF